MTAIAVREVRNRIQNLFLSDERETIGKILSELPIFVINLSHREKRLNRTIKNLRKIGVTNFERFEAVEDPIGIRGCAKSHLAIWETLHLARIDTALICEDDFKFVGNLRRLREALEESVTMPQVKFVAFAGLVKDDGARISRNLKVTHDLQAAACYLVKRDVLNELIESNKISIQMLTESNGRIGSHDKVWKSLQTGQKFAVPIHKACRQYYGYSDIKKEIVFYES